MGFALESCPTMTQCCMWVPLRPAAALVSLAGVAGAIALLLIYGFGAEWLAAAGAPEAAAGPARLAIGALGLLLLAAHALLAAAVWAQSDSLCEVYAWGVLALLAPTAAMAVALAVWALILGRVAFALTLLCATAGSVLLLLYFVIVVTNYKMTLP